MTQPTNDPWETPSAWFDPELIETSRRLMAKSISTSESDAPHGVPSGASTPPDPPDAKDLRISRLEQDKQRLFQRNVGLLAEVTRLRVENQHLQQFKLKQSRNWLIQFFKRLGQS